MGQGFLVWSTGRGQRTHHRHRKWSRDCKNCPQTSSDLLKRVKGLPWDGQGLVRRGRRPKLVLPEQSMAQTGGTLRTGGSSPIRLGPTDVKVDAETEWTPVTRRRRFRSKTPDLAVVEETKRLRSTGPISDTSDNTKLTDEETRKRALVESTGDDDDEPAEKYWRAEDFVAKASIDELTRNWLTDEDAADTPGPTSGCRRRARQAGRC